MALLKSITLPSGVAATYHKITLGTVDFIKGQTTIEMQGYRDQAASDDGLLPLLGSSLTINGAPTFDGDPRNWAYAQVKARPEWADASDV